MKIAIVGAGLAGCSCARLLADKGLKIDLFEKENHIGGLLYDKEGDEVFQHYGPHIFHTSNPQVINFILRFAEWEGFCNRPIAITDLGMARLPISLETVLDLKGDALGDTPGSLDSYKDLISKNIIEGYSKKQWGDGDYTNAVKRLKISDTISGSYFGDVFEGLPKGGFYKFLENMIDHKNIKIYLNKKFIGLDKYEKVIWTGPIDECPNIGIKLKWIGTLFKRVKNNERFLAPVYNYNISGVEYTRATKMCLLTGCSSTDVLQEYPRQSNAKHYVIINEDEKKQVEDIIKGLGDTPCFCGRSATARYLDMDEVIENAFEITEKF